MHKKVFPLLSLLLILLALKGCSLSKTSTDSDNIELSILQLNLWVECTKVENAPQYLVEQLAYYNPDIAVFCELFKGEDEDPILPFLVSKLKAKDLNYYSAQIDGRAIISKYPIIEKEKINQWSFKAVLDVDGKRIVVYPAHAEHRYYACYYPRGYNDGSTDWNKLNEPITDVDKILEINGQSGRVESVQDVINDAQKEIKKGASIFFAGDFNEPSHLDWQEDTKNYTDHQGCIINWHVSKLLYSSGFKDAYREYYPDAVKYPGFTFPSNNKNVEIGNLTWAPEADERERIDFIYYYPISDLSIQSAKIAGPASSIVKSERKKENTQDVFLIADENLWPTDHKGVLVTFSIKR